MIHSIIHVQYAIFYNILCRLRILKVKILSPPSRFKRQLTQAPSGWFLVQALARSGLQPKDHSPAHRPEDAKYSDTCGGQAP